MMGRARDIERHERVYIRADCALVGVEARVEPALRAWAAAARPFVARRAGPDVAPGFIPLAWQSGRAKAAFSAPSGAVLRHEPPLPLNEALPVFPGAIAQAARRLDEEAAQRGVSLRLYGSWFWQAVSAAVCTTPKSDIDLLFWARSLPQLEAGLALLSDAAESLPLDGEIVFPGGWGVAWRELARGPDIVLAKNRSSAALLPRANLLSRLREAA